MLLKELIRELQELYDLEVMHKEIMGEPEIMIDSFKKLDGKREFIYKGFSKNIEIQRSGDGVYPILAAKETWE